MSVTHEVLVHSLAHVAHRLAIAGAMALGAAAVGATGLHAQTCSPQIRDPECAPLHAPTAAIAPRVATVNYPQVVLNVEVTDAYGIQQPGSGSVLGKLIGSQLNPISINLTWSLKAGPGWNYVSLTSGLNVFVVTATNLQGQTFSDTAKITYEPPPAQTGPV